ncbi:MAG: ATP-binding protein [Polyangiales bacterium]
MSSQKLPEFIRANREEILAEWDRFARTVPSAGSMSKSALRDHADEILAAIVRDIEAPLSTEEGAKASYGQYLCGAIGELGKLHAAERTEHGFDLAQVVAEFRALRASVLNLWHKHGIDPEGITRFNEAIDEALVESAKQHVELTERYRDELLGIVGHDLRNPLTGIMLGARTLMNSAKREGRNATVPERLLNSAKRMQRIVADVVDFTRMRFGRRIPIHTQPSDMEPIWRQVIAELEEPHRKAPLRFTTEGDLHGDWDPDRLAQVFSNLLGNAIQHGSKHEPIDISARASGDDVVVDVHNAGKPISADALEAIFEPRVGVASQQDDGKSGLGLGLFIAKHIVTAHGGSIDARSSANEGTTFRVRLPRHTLDPHKRVAA